MECIDEQGTTDNPSREPPANPVGREQLTLNNMAGTRLILASASPRRSELLTQAGYTIEVVRPPFDEPDEMGPAVPAEAQAEALSYFKARSVANTITDGLIIAADTVVGLDRAVYGKPRDADDARRILRALAGTTHQVISGLTLLEAKTRRRMIGHDTTVVTMRSLSPKSVESYLASGAWQGKAGAYGIQASGDAFIERIDGSFTNVVGLPMELLARMLTDWGYQPVPDRTANDLTRSNPRSGAGPGGA